MPDNILCTIPQKSFRNMCKLTEGCLKTKRSPFLDTSDFIMLTGEQECGPVTAYACSGVALVRYIVPGSITQQPFRCYIQPPRFKPSAKDSDVTIFAGDKQTGVSFRAMGRSRSNKPVVTVTQMFDTPETIRGSAGQSMPNLREIYEKLTQNFNDQSDTTTTVLNANYLQAMPAVESHDARVFVTQGAPLTPVKFQQDSSEFFILPMRPTHHDEHRQEKTP